MTTLETTRPSRRSVLKGAGAAVLLGFHLPSRAALAQAAARRPLAFDPLRAMARITARPHCASDVYARFALDISLGVGVESQ